MDLFLFAQPTNNNLKYKNLNRLIAAMLLTYIYILRLYIQSIYLRDLLKVSSAEQNSLLAVNRQTNIYPSSIERELIEKTTIFDRLDNSSFSQFQ